MLVRLATESDLDAMTWVLIGASPLDPIYPYRFPDREEHPDKFKTLCQQKCAEYLATSTVVVCEMEIAGTGADAEGDPAGGGGRTARAATKVVAFSAWDTPIRWLQPVGEPPLSHPTAGYSHHQHHTSGPITIGHKTRMQAFRTQCTTSKRHFFDLPYSRSPQRGHMFLKILLCHPLYQRRGAGSALTRWGIERAAEHGLDTTVFASPMGLELYKKLGFKEVGKFRVQVDGDSEFLEIPALVLPWRRVAEREVGSEGGRIWETGTMERGRWRGE